MSTQYNEVPSGAINSSNVTYTLLETPNPAQSLALFLNGIYQFQGAGKDYTLSGVTITFTTAPTTGDTLLAGSYQYGQSTSNTGSTITLQSLANFFSTQADLLPLTGIGGYTNEPFMSMANDALSDLICDPSDWKFNRAVLPIIVTCPFKQDYKFSGAEAFSLGSTSQGWAIDLASNSAITVTAGVVTVNTIEPHRFAIGDVVFINNVIAKSGNSANAGKYNSTFTDNGNASAWTGGYTITAITSNSFSFAAASGQNNGDVLGSPGVFNFAYGTSASMVEMIDTSSPQYVQELSVRREMPVASRINNPSKVAVINDDYNGTITVRFYLVPGNTAWGATIVYQQKAPVKSQMTDTIAPFPDHMTFVVRQAILYRMRMFTNHPMQEQEFSKLQVMIKKALGFGETEATDVSLKPEDPLMDDSVSPQFFNFY